MVSLIGGALQAQTVQGVVRDAVTGEVLPGATIQVLGTEWGAVTDGQGLYQLNNIKPGRYQLQATFVGYQAALLPEVWVKTGRLNLADFSLSRDEQNLDEVVVAADVPMSTPGKLLLTEEQINRFAATYYDPARLALTSPDVLVANDQNNLVSVRGISPDYNVWRLEGAEIVNPNHTSNAGTLTDRPTGTGGGVNILSAQMLSNSSFNYSTFDNTYGNSVGGIFDMSLKAGNQEERQYTAQASLIGFDLATEGPYKKGGKATYAANYRYSFTGLLTQMGVDFGGESIGFQDLALATTLPLGKKTKLKLFGVGGLSFNYFDHRPFTESETDKDRKDIYFDSRMGLAGASATTQLRNARWSQTLVYSGYANSRAETQYNGQDEFESLTEDENRFAIISFRSQYSHLWGSTRLETGVMTNLYNYWQRNSFLWQGQEIPTRTTSERIQTLFQPFMQWQHRLSARARLQYGLTYNLTANSEQSLDPRVSLQLLTSAYSTLTLAMGRYSQLYQPYNVQFDGWLPVGNVAVNQEFIQSNRYTIAWDLQRNGWAWNSEFFHYRFPSVRTFFENATSAETTGISTTVERAFNGSHYYRLGGSVFDAPISGQSRNRFDSDFNLSLAAGKEWNREQNGENRNWSVNGKLLYQGGQNLAMQTGWWGWPGWWWGLTEYRTRDYFRIDLRVQWVRYREKYTRMIALDIQNMLNTQNESFRYFDNMKGELVKQKQLGLIPILTYRVEW